MCDSNSAAVARTGTPERSYVHEDCATGAAMVEVANRRRMAEKEVKLLRTTIFT